MDEIDWCAGRLAERHRALGGDQLGQHRSGVGVEAERATSLGDEPLGRGRHDRGVLAVQHRQDAGVAGGGQQVQESRHVTVEAGAHHEHLEARVPRPSKCLELRSDQCRVTDDRVQDDVGDRLRFYLGGRLGHRLGHLITAEGDEVRDRGDAARKRRRRAAGVVVDPVAAQMHVRVDAARQHEQPIGVDLARTGAGGQTLADLIDETVADAQVPPHGALVRDDRAVADDQLRGLSRGHTGAQPEGDGDDQSSEMRWSDHERSSLWTTQCSHEHGGAMMPPSPRPSPRGRGGDRSGEGGAFLKWVPAGRRGPSRPCRPRG